MRRVNSCSLALSSSLRCIDSFWFACQITSQSSWTLNISQPSFLLRPGQTWGVGKFSFYFLFSSLAARQCGKVMFLQKFDKLPPKFYFQLSLIPMGSLSRGMESSMTTGSYRIVLIGPFFHGPAALLLAPFQYRKRKD